MSSWLDHLQHYRAIAVIRSPNIQQGVQMAQAVAAGGMKFIEITWNSEQPEELIGQLRKTLPHCYIGTGTILNPEQMQRAIAAGTQFIFSPHVDPALIAIANEAGIPIIPGALTPTEMVRAWQAGATCVKVFPIQAVGGASYIKALQGPLGQIPLIPTGGVTLENVRDFIEAGAIAVGLSGQLFPPALLKVGDWHAIAQRAQRCQQECKKPEQQSN